MAQIHPIIDKNGIREDLYWLEMSYGTDFELGTISGKIADEADFFKVFGFAFGATTAIGASGGRISSLTGNSGPELHMSVIGWEADWWLLQAFGTKLSLLRSIG